MPHEKNNSKKENTRAEKYQDIFTFTHISISFLLCCVFIFEKAKFIDSYFAAKYVKILLTMIVFILGSNIGFLMEKDFFIKFKRIDITAWLFSFCMLIFNFNYILIN